MDAAELASKIDCLLGRLDGDAAVNGLQVDGGGSVQFVGTAVTLTARVLDIAVNQGIDTLLVHHGVLWRGSSDPISGAAHLRLKTMLTNEISLIAFHLPLDAHPMIGNSAQVLGLISGCEPAQGLFHEVEGSPPWTRRWTPNGLLALNRDSIGPFEVRFASDEGLRLLTTQMAGSITVATGKGDSVLTGEVGLRGDLLVTGELSLQAFEAASDEGRAVACIGHHDSEVAGITALGNWVRDEMSLSVTAINSPCPV